MALHPSQNVRGFVPSDDVQNGSARLEGFIDDDRVREVKTDRRGTQGTHAGQCQRTGIGHALGLGHEMSFPSSGSGSGWYSAASGPHLGLRCSLTWDR